MRELYHSSKIIITKHYTIYNVYNAYYVYAHIYVFVGVCFVYACKCRIV